METTPMYKALIFDLDQTLVIYTTRVIDRRELYLYLKELKTRTGVYMAVASFNSTFGPEIVETHFPDLFDCVVCDAPIDVEDWSKVNMLQKVRKQYSKHMKTIHNRSTKLRWKEMLMFDDNSDVLAEFKKRKPPIPIDCILVNNKTGVTLKNHVLQSLFARSDYMIGTA